MADEGETWCLMHPGQAHSKEHEYPVPANDTTDLIEVMEVVKRGRWWEGGTIRSESKSEGRSGPLVEPVSCLSLTTPSTSSGVQRPFWTVGGSTRGTGSPSGGGAVDVDTRLERLNW